MRPTRSVGHLEKVAREAFCAVVSDAGIDAGDIRYVATTGFGRANVSFRDIQITDITCGARAAAFLFPSTTCVLDIGCQSTRATRLDDRGRVRQFRTNDKCAAGTGAFLAKVALLAQVNRNLPFMYGDAVVPPDYFDAIVDDPKYDFPLFAPPNPSVSTADYLIALRIL